MLAASVRTAIALVVVSLAAPLQPSWALPSCCKSIYSASGCPYCSTDSFGMAVCYTWAGDGSCQCRSSAIWGSCTEYGSCTFYYGEVCPISARQLGGEPARGKAFAYHPFFRPPAPAMPTTAGPAPAGEGHGQGQ